MITDDLYYDLEEKCKRPDEVGALACICRQVMDDRRQYRVALEYLIHRVLSISETVASGETPHGVAHAAYRTAALEARANLHHEKPTSREEGESK